MIFKLFKEYALNSTGDGSKGAGRPLQGDRKQPPQLRALAPLCPALYFQSAPLTGLFSFLPFFFSSLVLRGALICVRFKSLLSCVQLICDLMNYSPSGSSVHGILQVRTLEWIVISFSRGSSKPRDRIRVSCSGRPILNHRATWEAPEPLIYPIRTALTG